MYTLPPPFFLPMSSYPSGWRYWSLETSSPEKPLERPRPCYAMSMGTIRYYQWNSGMSHRRNIVDQGRSLGSVSCTGYTTTFRASGTMATHRHPSTKKTLMCRCMRGISTRHVCCLLLDGFPWTLSSMDRYSYQRRTWTTLIFVIVSWRNS